MVSAPDSSPKPNVEKSFMARTDTAERLIQGRPDRVSRAYVLEMLTPMFCHALPADVMEPLLNYLLRKKVLKDLYYHIALPEGQGDLATYPDDARVHLLRAITAHANSDACPAILRDVLLQGKLTESPSVAARPSAPDMERIERVLWDRNAHVRALSDFGVEEAHRVFEVITYLMVGKPVPPPPEPVPDNRTEIERKIAAYSFNDASIRQLQTQLAPRAAEHRRRLLADPAPALVSVDSTTGVQVIQAVAGELPQSAPESVAAAKTAKEPDPISLWRAESKEWSGTIALRKGVERTATQPEFEDSLEDLEEAKLKGQSPQTRPAPMQHDETAAARRNALDRARRATVALRDATTSLFSLARDGNQEQLLRRLAGRLQEEVYRLAQTDPLPHVNPIELIRMTKDVATEIIDAMEARQNQAGSGVAGQWQTSDAPARNASDAESANVPVDECINNLPGSWVPSTACIDKSVPELPDHTRVRRYCKKHGIPTRQKGKQRLEVHWESFQTVRKEIEKSAEKQVDSMTARLESVKKYEQAHHKKFPI